MLTGEKRKRESTNDESLKSLIYLLDDEYGKENLLHEHKNSNNQCTRIYICQNIKRKQ